MKTKEQIKTKVINYINKTSEHLFIRVEPQRDSKIDFIINDKPENFIRVLIERNNIIFIDGNKVTIYDIDKYITYHHEHTLNVIKHKLFLIPNYNGYTTDESKRFNKNVSVKYFKRMKEQTNLIKESISGKTDPTEIKDIITKLITGVEEIKVEKTFLQKIFGK